MIDFKKHNEQIKLIESMKPKLPKRVKYDGDIRIGINSDSNGFLLEIDMYDRSVFKNPEGAREFAACIISLTGPITKDELAKVVIE